MMPNKVSVVLPTYNESGHIVDLVKNVIDNIPSGWEYEIFVVDDNSPDHTHDVVTNAFRDNPSVIAVLRTFDRGFAKSIRTGIERASGNQIIVMDSDFTHDPVEIPRLLQVGAVYDIVSGSRFCAGGRMMDTAHYLASMLYNWFVRIVIRTQIQDNLGGYFTISADTKFDSSDFRNTVPRFAEEARKANQALVDAIGAIAADKKVTSAQVALAWLLARKPWIVPIPGTTKLNRVEENIGSAAVVLTADELRNIENAVSAIAVQGERYSPQQAARIDR